MRDWIVKSESMKDEMISKQAAIKSVCTMLKNCFNATDEMLESVKITVGELPPAEQWIPTSSGERLPETEEKVLVTCEHLDIYGKPHRYVCKAYHVDRYTVRADFDYWDEGCDEYREEDDQYYVLEGWYEYIHNWGDYCSVRITEDKVLAWSPLPEPYKEDADG